MRNNVVIGDNAFHDIFVRANPVKCIGKTYNRDFSATLAWYDPAGTSSCAKCLVNDLDLIVTAVNAKGKVIPNSRVYPNNSNTEKDHINNVERVRFKMNGRRRYRIRIHASNIVTDTTKFSLIATGCFELIRDPAKI